MILKRFFKIIIYLGILLVIILSGLIIYFKSWLYTDQELYCYDWQEVNPTNQEIFQEKIKDFNQSQLENYNLHLSYAELKTLVQSSSQNQSLCIQLDPQQNQITILNRKTWPLLLTITPSETLPYLKVSKTSLAQIPLNFLNQKANQSFTQAFYHFFSDPNITQQITGVDINQDEIIIKTRLKDTN